MTLLLDGLIVVALGVMYTPMFRQLIESGWDKADYTHAFFILPIFVWLVYEQRRRLARKDDVTPGQAVLLGVSLCLYTYSAINEFLFLQTFSFVCAVWALFAIKFSKQTVQQLKFPLVYLLFLIPPPRLVIDTLTTPLKVISTQGSFYLLKMAQLPVEVRGAILKVGEYELFVADACSGWRSVVTLLALGALYAHRQKTTPAKKWILFASVIPIAILANIFRIFLTGCLSHFFGVKYAEGFFHEFSGAVVFLVGVFGLIAFSDFLNKRSHVKR